MVVPEPTPIYHLTHWRNLPSILSTGGVLSNHEMLRRQIVHQNIAYDHIQERRETTMVFGAEGGCLHDYVPFHFAPKSPMLYTISKGNVLTYTEGRIRWFIWSPQRRQWRRLNCRSSLRMGMPQ